MDYDTLVEVYLQLERTTKRLEKTWIISQFLKSVKPESMPEVVLLLQGIVFPTYDERKLGVADRLVIKALNVATGIDVAEIESVWKKFGDLGEVSKSLATRKRQQTLYSQKLTVRKVFTNLQKLAEFEGKGTVDQKVKLIAELLSSATPDEAKYIIKTIMEELRVGVAFGVLRDAIVWAHFGEESGISFDPKTKEVTISNRDKYHEFVIAVQEAYDVSNDFATVAKAAGSGVDQLKKIGLTVGVPIKVMLALKAESPEDGLERVGIPAELEYKYDGFRMQIHKSEKRIRIFTRRLEDVTAQFPEVVSFVSKLVKGSSFILDSEAVGFDSKTKKYMPFQNISQRIKRKYDIDELAKKQPVELNIFDIVSYEGKSLISTPFEERRRLLEKVVREEPLKLVLAKKLIANSVKEVEQFFKESLDKGNEGIMIKNLQAPYKPGARVGYMLKLKPTLDTIDLVVVAAEWGEGKRAKWLSSYTVACVDEDGTFSEVGKVSTGLKEKREEGVSFDEMTEVLKPLILKEKGKQVFVKPKIVVSVTYAEIQKSPTYASGYALRFPTFVAIRYDRGKDDVASCQMMEDLYKNQKK
ncbi:MAG: ATP-dependent DNA ligase [Candidatus Woesearchaeota archaeon]